jgi:hypothetical protein
MEVKRVIKKQLVLDLDKNEAPSGWRWAVDRVVDFGNGEQVVPGFVPATADEVESHMRVAIAKQAQDIAADSKERDAIAAARDAALAERDQARAKLAARDELDAKYDEAVKPLRLQALA